MDVNPYQFKTDFSDFEFSTFHMGQRSNLLLCSMAWNKGEEAPKKEKVVPKPKSEKSKARLENQKEQRKDSGESADDPRMAETEGGENDASEVEGDEDEDEGEWEDELDEAEIEREALELQYETIHYWAVRMSPFYKQQAGSKEPFLETHLAIANRLGTESGRCEHCRRCDWLLLLLLCCCCVLCAGPPYNAVNTSHQQQQQNKTKKQFNNVNRSLPNFHSSIHPFTHFISFHFIFWFLFRSTLRGKFMRDQADKRRSRVGRRSPLG